MLARLDGSDERRLTPTTTSCASFPTGAASPSGPAPAASSSTGRPRQILTRPNPPSPSGKIYDLSADYDVLPGDRGLVMPAREGDDADAEIVLVLDCFDELRERVGRGCPSRERS